MKFTILGAKGFVGSNIVNHLLKNGIDCFTPEIREVDISNEYLGHVIYAIGIPNFKQRPFDAVEAHVCTLKNILLNTKFDSFLYLSGTRVYLHTSSTNEDAPITVNPTSLEDLYNISKVMGESLCLSINNPAIRIARLSNVTGNNFTSSLFLPSIIRDAIDKKKIIVHTKLESKKDYIHIDDVVKMVQEITLNGKHRIYNIASGKNTRSKEIVDEISRVTGCSVEEYPNSLEYSFPKISIERLVNEFQFSPSSIIEKLENIIISYKNFRKINSC